jgi:hypothetical protein
MPLWNCCCTVLKQSLSARQFQTGRAAYLTTAKVKTDKYYGDYLQRLVGTFWKFKFTLNLFMLVLLKKYIINLHTNYTGQQPLLKFVPPYPVSNSFATKCFNTGLNSFHGSVAS